MTDVKVGDKVRMLEGNEDFWNKGVLGTVVLQDHDGDFWVAFGDDQSILRPDTPWFGLEDHYTWCVGSVQNDNIHPLEVIS